MSIFGVVFILFYQNYKQEPVAEIEVETAIVEEMSDEENKRSNFRNLLEDEVIELHVVEDFVISYYFLDLYFDRGLQPSYYAFKLEIPIPPPEQPLC